MQSKAKRLLGVLLSFVVVLFLIISCNSGGGSGGGSSSKATVSIRVGDIEIILPDLFDCSTEEDALTEDEVLEALTELLEAFFVEANFTPEQWQQIIAIFVNGVTIEVIDDYAMPCGDGNETSYCQHFSIQNPDGSILIIASIYTDDHDRASPVERTVNVVCPRLTDTILELTENIIWEDKDCEYWGFLPESLDGLLILFDGLELELERAFLGTDEPRRVFTPTDCFNPDVPPAGPGGPLGGGATPTPTPTPEPDLCLTDPTNPANVWICHCPQNVCEAAPLLQCHGQIPAGHLSHIGDVFNVTSATNCSGTTGCIPCS